MQQDWWWKARLGKCYYQLGMLREAEKQFLSALKSADMVTTVLELSKVVYWHSFDANMIHDHACLLPKARCGLFADMVKQAMQQCNVSALLALVACLSVTAWIACSAICLDASCL